MQIDEWQERYGGNVYVVDEVTGRIYVMKGDLLERVPEIASRRRREDTEMSTPPTPKKRCRHGNPRDPKHTSTSCGVHKTNPPHPRK